MSRAYYELVKTLWDYNHTPTSPDGADVLIVMGTNDLGVPRFASELAKKYQYKSIVVTGGVSHQYSPLGEPFGGTEAEVFLRIMTDTGCPEALILMENSARNTGANILESRTLLDSRKLGVASGQLVHTPTMQRRALATAQKQWKSVDWRISSEPTCFDDYIRGRDFNYFTHGLVGDTYRIWHYPTMDFQTEQFMPDDVKAALRELLQMGFTNTLRNGYSLEGL